MGEAEEAEAEAIAAAQAAFPEEWKDALSDVVDMGFDEDPAKDALKACDGNLKAAIKYPSARSATPPATEFWNRWVNLETEFSSCTSSAQCEKIAIVRPVNSETADTFDCRAPLHTSHTTSRLTHHGAAHRAMAQTC